jgi:hypothetical protein
MVFLFLVVLCAAIFSGCGGSGGGSSSVSEVTPTFSIGGTVVGLSGELTMQLNQNESFVITNNGDFFFATKLKKDAAYDTSIVVQPVGQLCNLTQGSGIVASKDVTSVQILCEDISYRIGGTVNGLVGDLVVQIGGGESIRLTGDGSFNFSVAPDFGDAYSVAVLEQPLSQSCVALNASGVVLEQDTIVSIACTSSGKPVVTHVWPAHILGGHEVRISGSNLSSASVSYGGVTMSPVVNSDHDLRFDAPNNSAGTYSLVIENSGGSVSLQLNQAEALQNVLDVSGGGRHTCAVIGGGVRCWGQNYDGQLGNGEEFGSVVPTNVFGIDNALRVSAGFAHSCAVLQTGSVKCWGNNAGGQLGDGTFVANREPVVVANVTNAVCKVPARYFAGVIIIMDNWGVATHKTVHFPYPCPVSATRLT